MPESTCSPPANRFLSDVRVASIESGEPAAQFGDALVDGAVAECAERGFPIVVAEEEEPQIAVLCIPVFCSGQLTSVVALKVGDDDARVQASPPIGVLEVWQPIGRYRELNLTSGYFGQLDRFQNVSSFVRFEKGMGLPGQVWAFGHAIIHDDLRNHPGFLRAAGASADALTTAIGIPVVRGDFIATVVLISSKTTPLARGFEVWTAGEDTFELQACSYAETNDSIALAEGTRVRSGTGVLGQVQSSGQAILSDRPELINSGRPDHGGGEIGGVLAIPVFESDKLSSVTSLLF